MKELFSKVKNSKYFWFFKKSLAHLADIALDDHEKDFNECRKKNCAKWVHYVRIILTFFLRYVRAYHKMKGSADTLELRRNLYERQAEARFLLSLMSIFEGDTIPENLFEYCASLSFTIDN